MEIKEFNIPVPWGSIAVKAWGNENNTPVLAVHGFGDNAGSFDRLIPLLPPSYYYICIDIPNHGRSSMLPPYTVVSYYNILHSLKLVLNYLKKGPYIYMGHSWGGTILIYFSQLYPEHVLKIVSLDGIYVYPFLIKSIPFAKSRCENFMKTCSELENNDPSTYTYEEAKEKLNKNRLFGRLSDEAADALLKRSLVTYENGKYLFANNPRNNLIAFCEFDLMYSSEILKKNPIQCPILLIISDEYKSEVKKVMPQLEALKQGSKMFIMNMVDENHHVHINKPEIVAPIINQFLSHKHKL